VALCKSKSMAEMSASAATCFMYHMLASVVKCLWEEFVWGFGVVFLSCVCVGVGGVVLCRCVCV